MSHIVATIGQGGFGTVITANVKQRDSSNKLIVLPLVAGSDVVYFVFHFDDGSRNEFLGTIIDGPNGVCRYTTAANLTPDDKTLRLQLRIVRLSPSSDIITKTVALDIERRY